MALKYDLVNAKIIVKIQLNYFGSSTLNLLITGGMLQSVAGT